MYASVMKRFNTVFVLAFIVLTFCCSKCDQKDISLYEPIPFPKENPISSDKIALGERLFFDKRLSKDNSISCASCHVPSLAFSDGRKVSIGVNGGLTERNAPTLLNVGYQKTLMFDAHISSLELQAIVPIQEHVEMDMSMIDLINKLKVDSYYIREAKRLFNRTFDAYVLTRSLATFQRSLISQNAPFDHFYRDKQTNAISQSAQLGWNLFSGRLNCVSCHPPPFFTHFKAENNGLYSRYDQPDKGRFRIFNDSSDIGKFKVPSLRNIELTFPYMHDGRFFNLDAVLDHYTNKIADLPNLDSNLKSIGKSGIILSNDDKANLLAFLQTLNDKKFVSNTLIGEQ
jgi:cytochrome c peroxidase